MNALLRQQSLACLLHGVQIWGPLIHNLTVNKNVFRSLFQFPKLMKGTPPVWLLSKHLIFGDFHLPSGVVDSTPLGFKSCEMVKAEAWHERRLAKSFAHILLLPTLRPTVYKWDLLWDTWSPRVGKY